MSTTVLAFLFMIGMAGSAVARGISYKLIPWWCTIFTSLAASLLWGWTSRTARDLPWASAVFNVISMTGFMIGCTLFGDKLSSSQITGLILTLLGIGLMSL
jgi:multidrug transporter EmrE-like cation transporter